MVQQTDWTQTAIWYSSKTGHIQQYGTAVRQDTDSNMVQQTDRTQTAIWYSRQTGHRQQYGTADSRTQTAIWYSRQTGHRQQYGAADRQDTDSNMVQQTDRTQTAGNMTRLRRDAICMPGDYNIPQISAFSATMVTRTRIIVTLFEHCLSC